jgi:MoaA/NifB/PqqE/SkfB family radical SAM enzyme
MPRKSFRSSIEQLKNLITRCLPIKWSRRIFAEWRLLKFNFRKNIEFIEFHLAEHCNLNCAGCDHFSPLAAEEYADLETVEKDMKRLSELTGGSIREIRILGGEPLLHKEAAAFFPVVRKYFPTSVIFLFNNGTLLARQPAAFWEACRDNSINLLVTRYPVKIDTETIKAKCKEYKVRFLHPPAIKENDMYRCVLSLGGKGNIKENWKYCIHNLWTFLHNGRIYPCPFYANIRHFNRYFNKDLPLTGKDSIDIYKVNSLKEIMRFLAKPIPACRYCDISAYTYGHKWAVSRKDISEWT